MQSETSQDDHDKVFEMILAGWATQAVRTLAALSVAEHLAAGPLTAHQIAERESSDPDMTYRVLRAGAAMGLLEYDADAAVFSGTRMLQVLHKDSPVSLKHFAQSAPAETYWWPLVHMPETVARGKNYVTEVLGGSVFEYYERHKEAGRLFSAGMTDVSTPVIREAVVAIDAADARSVVDIGGANGTFVAELLVRHPQLTGVVLELPQAMPAVAEEARRHNLEGRMTGAAGRLLRRGARGRHLSSQVHPARLGRRVVPEDTAQHSTRHEPRGARGHRGNVRRAERCQCCAAWIC